VSQLKGKDTTQHATKGKYVPIRNVEKLAFEFRPLQSIPFSQVQIADTFWNQRLEANRKVTIPTSFEKCKDNRIHNFARASHPKGGAFIGLACDDSDLYKIIEGAAYCLHDRPDQDMEDSVDKIIDLIASAQWKDGYLFTFHTLPQRQPSLRWTDLQNKHELYCAGHLVEAGIAYYEATGKRKLLDVAIKFADHIDSTFGPTKKRGVAGHPEIEIALVKLYQVTGNTNYLNLATFFLDERGYSHQRETYGIYAQDHKPIIHQDEAVGHAVRAMYLYSGMADVAAATRNPAYLDTLRKLWQDIVSKKLYLTGGIGARHETEGFGDAYELSNKMAYCETCAAIALIMYNHRMFLFHKDAEFYDVLERTLYNNMIAGVSLTGDTFFYQNVLESDGQCNINKGLMTRQPWFECSCCPTNVARFIPTIPGYIYARQNDTFYVNLFITSTVTFEMYDDNRITLHQVSNYPWDGQIRFTIDANTPMAFTVKLRIPGWSRNNPIPSELYRYLDPDDEQIKLRVNGRKKTLNIENGFAVLDRTWETGDTIDLHLPMPIRRVLCHEGIKENQGKVALERGPIVYCAEGTDNEGRIGDLILPDDTELHTEYRQDLLNGINVIRGMAKTSQSDPVTNTENHTQLPFLAIPYYAWSHRGAGEMAIWLHRQVSP